MTFLVTNTDNKVVSHYRAIAGVIFLKLKLFCTVLLNTSKLCEYTQKSQMQPLSIQCFSFFQVNYY